MLSSRLLEMNFAPNAWPLDACLKQGSGCSKSLCRLVLSGVLLLDVPTPHLRIMYCVTAQ